MVHFNCLSIAEIKIKRQTIPNMSFASLIGAVASAKETSVSFINGFPVCVAKFCFKNKKYKLDRFYEIFHSYN